MAIHVKHTDILREITGVYFIDKTISNIYLGTQLIWTLAKDVVSSCFGAGYWINDKPWLNDDNWRNN